MSAVASLAFPGGRTLASWWRQLSPFQPHSLWIAHLHVYRIEALVRVDQSCRADDFALLVLDALSQGPDAIETLEARLHLNRQFLFRALKSMLDEGLAAAPSTGLWHITPAGAAARATGIYHRSVFERRAFHFLAHGAGSFSFLPLPRPAGEPWATEEAGPINLAVLENRLTENAGWKERFSFPADVAGLVRETDAADADIPEWRKVIVIHPLRLPVALVLSDDVVLGFSFRQDGWLLDTRQPVFTLRAAWPELFPELGVETPAEAWRQAWRESCQSRGIPAAETEACRLESEASHLRAIVSRTIGDRFKGEIWLLGGEGNIRRAMRVEMVW